MHRVRLVLAAAAFLTSASVSSAVLADARADKVELYIEVHNQFAQQMQATHARYLEAIQGLDPQAPCTAERQPRGLYHAGDSTGTISGFRRRLRRGPRLPEDALVGRMLDAAASHLPAWNTLFDYYGRRVFTTDACALGNAKHRELMAAFEQFLGADRELITFLEGETARARQRELVETERRYGQNFRYHHLAFVEEIEKLRGLLGASPIDVDAVDREAAAIEALHATIAPRAQTSPREIHSDLYEGHYLIFLQSIESLASSAHAFVAAFRANSGTPRDRARAASDLDRAASSLDRAFDEAIRASNGVRYSDAVR